MSYIFATLMSTARRWAWISLVPIVATCSASETTSTTDATPGTVSDLSVASTSEASATLAFSQVGDGMGQPASYDVRHSVTPMSWGAATPTANGTCTTPLQGTGVSGTVTCTVLGLSPSTSYDFQVRAFRGTLNVNAVFGGLSNVVAASTQAVTPLPPPPPQGGTLLFQEDFENGSLASRGWYDNTNVLLNTTEHVAGSTSSAQYRFLAGETVPTTGGSQRHKFTASNSFYVSYYMKYSANWVGSNHSYHPHEIYVLSSLDGDYDGPSENYLTVYLEHNYQNGGKPIMSMQDNKSVNYSYGPLPYNLVGVTENRSTAGCNGTAESNIYTECFNAGSYWYNSKQLLGPVVFQPNPGPGYKNDWNFVEAYFQLNTIVNGIGQKDGVMQYWFNGALILDRRDILFRTGARPTLQFNQFLIAPYIGDGSPVDQSMFIDNLRVGTGRLP